MDKKLDEHRLPHVATDLFPHHRPADQVTRRVLSLAGGVVAAALALGLAATANAQPRDEAATYPAKPIRLIVGFAPGGPTDLIAREISRGLQDSWGQPVIVENKPGASSRIAFEYVARAEPDGYTLIVAAVQTATNDAIYTRPSYDTLRDFAPVTQLTAAVSVLTAAPALKVNTVNELVQLARSDPGKLSYASFGVGSSAHFAGAMLEQRANIQLTHIPYNGAVPAQSALVGGQVDLGFMSALSALPQLKSGKLKALAVASNKRLPQLPDVPTMAEAGFPHFEVSSWQGLLAPGKTPLVIVEKLQREIGRILALPEVRERLSAQAAEPVASTPLQFRTYIESEIAKWRAVAKRANMIVE